MGSIGSSCSWVLFNRMVMFFLPLSPTQIPMFVMEGFGRMPEGSKLEIIRNRKIIDIAM